MSPILNSLILDPIFEIIPENSPPIGPGLPGYKFITFKTSLKFKPLEITLISTSLSNNSFLEVETNLRLLKLPRESKYNLRLTVYVLLSSVKLPIYFCSLEYLIKLPSNCFSKLSWLSFSTYTYLVIMFEYSNWKDLTKPIKPDVTL